jgi:putative thioredoxin
MSQVIAVDTLRFTQEVLEASATQPVLVDFWAAWCGPCRMLGPVLEQAAAEFAGRLKVVKIDTDAEPTLAARYAIRSIPAVKLFRHGEVVAEFVGAQPLHAIRSFLAPHLALAGGDDRTTVLAGSRKARAAGRPAEALACLQPLLVADGDAQGEDLQTELAACLALTGDAEGAERILDALRPASQAAPAVKEARALLRFVRIAASPDETDAIQTARVTAARAACRGAIDAALESLWSAASRNRRYATGEGRADLLAAFDLLPDDDPRLGAARRRWASLLN